MIGWHEQTNVFGPDGARITRPYAGMHTDLVLIPETPVQEAVQAIGNCLITGHEFVVHPREQRVETDTNKPESGYFQCLSSGTTSAPKRIRRSHQSWVASMQVNRDLFGLSHDDCFAVLGALSHSLSLYGMAEALYLGADLRVLSGLRPDRAKAALADVTVLYATPSQIRAICMGTDSHESMRLLLVGGGALDDATEQRARDTFPNAVLRQFYGASETSFIAISDESSPPGSVGKPYPGVQLSIRDSAGLETDEGEIWVSSPYVFDSYAQGTSDDTRQQGSFLTVGEMGRRDQAGNLYVLGRKSRMFTVADQNLFPEEIETWLLEQDGVNQAAILPQPDAKRGHVAIAVIQGKTDPGAVLNAARKHFGPLKAPRQIRVVSEWPRLGSGKTDLITLEAML